MELQKRKVNRYLYFIKNNYKYREKFQIWNKRFSKKFDVLIYLILITFIFVNAYLLYNYHIKEVMGPVIGDDEYVYFGLARAIADKMSYLGHGVYNPLYPFLTSIFFKIGSNDIETFYLCKIFNCVVFSSVAFPLYLIAKRHIHNRFFCLLVAMALSLYPWKVVVNLIVAEPLFFSLMIWYMYLYALHIEKKKIATAVGLGVCGGLLFLAKQVGMVAIIAVSFGFLYEYIFVDGRKKQYRRTYVLAIATSVLIVLPWMIRCCVVSGSPLGYTGEIESYSKTFGIWSFLTALAGNLSYLNVACHITFLMAFILSLFRIRRTDKERQSFLVTVSFYALGVVGMATLHYLHMPHVPFGRYVGTSVPLIVIIGISFILEHSGENLNKQLMGGLVAVLSLFSIAVNRIPFCLGAVSNYNQYDFAALRWIFSSEAEDIAALKWLYQADLTAEGTVSGALTWHTALYVAAIGLISVAVIILHLRWKGIRYIYVIGILTFAAYCGAYVCNEETKMFTGSNEGAEVFHYLIENKIDMESMYQLDSTLITTNADTAWMEDLGRKQGEVGIDSLSIGQLFKNTELKFDFGPEDGYVADGYLPVLAPWRADYFFEDERLFGFDRDKTFDGVNFFIQPIVVEGSSYEKNSDLNYGTTENIFYINNGGGIYDINLTTNSDISSLAPFPLGCSIYVNDQYAGDFNDDCTELYLTACDSGEGPITIRFVPKEGCIWAIGAIEVFPRESKGYHDVYVLMNASQYVPLDAVFENERFKVCYKN